MSGTGTYAYVAWEDDSTGSGDIYFARGSPPSAPTVTSESFGTYQNQSQTLTLSGSDPAGLPLTFSIVTGPSHGVLGPVTSTGANSGQITYTPNPNYKGSDSFMYKATDGTQTSSSGLVSLAVYASSPSGGGGGGGRGPLRM